MDNAQFVTLDGVRTTFSRPAKAMISCLFTAASTGRSIAPHASELNFHELSKHFHVYAFDKLGMGEYRTTPRAMPITPWQR